MYSVHWREIVLQLHSFPGNFRKFQGSMSCIDLTICSPNLSQISGWRVDSTSPCGSDHFPIFSSFGCSVLNNINGSMPRWKLGKADWSMYRSECLNTFSGEIYDNDINVYCNNIVIAINSAASRAIPKSSGKPSKKTPVPWWNEDCSLAVKERKQAKNRAKRTMLFEDVIEYKKKKAVAQRVIKSCQKLHWRNFCSTLNSQSSVTTVWRKVKAVRGGNSSNNIPTISANNTEFVTCKEKCDILAENFAFVSSSSNYSPEFLQTKEETEERYNFDNILFDELSINCDFNILELKQALHSTKDSSPEEDNVTYSMIKNMPDQCLNILLLFFNTVWSKMRLPDSWKSAVVIPIPKPGKNPSLPTSYRPISLTSNLCKVMEKMINTRLLWFLDKNNLLSSVQSGFRKRRSTIDHILTLENDIRGSILNKESLLAVFLDIEKAYDMVWKKGLLIKMRDMGINGNMLGWVKDFLTDRKICVRIGRCFSRSVSVENGTPQGSVISPTLFNLAINDLPNVVNPKLRCSLFADDKAVWFHCKNLNLLKKAIQTSLNSILAWGNKWGFKFSSSKTEAVLFTRKRKIEEIQLYLNKSQIQICSSFKYLGVTLDKKLTWGDHIQSIVVKCKKSLNLMRAVSGKYWGADFNTLILLYRSLIRSRLDYCSEGYESACLTLKQRLDSIQCAALRICNRRNENYSS